MYGSCLPLWALQGRWAHLPVAAKGPALRSLRGVFPQRLLEDDQSVPQPWRPVSQVLPSPESCQLASDQSGVEEATQNSKGWIGNEGEIKWDQYSSWKLYAFLFSRAPFFTERNFGRGWKVIFSVYFKEKLMNNALFF